MFAWLIRLVLKSLWSLQPVQMFTHGSARMAFLNGLPSEIQLGPPLRQSLNSCFLFFLHILIAFYLDSDEWVNTVSKMRRTQQLSSSVCLCVWVREIDKKQTFICTSWCHISKPDASFFGESFISWAFKSLDSETNKWSQHVTFVYSDVCSAYRVIVCSDVRRFIVRHAGDRKIHFKYFSCCWMMF